MSQEGSVIRGLQHGPTEKERKYDRQLRLWAASGQAALESANVLLVNSGPGTVGIEALKNLVLPGIGKFTIADDAIIQEADLGVNFFLDEACLGKSRALCCAEYLVELNPEVSGNCFPEEDDPFDLEKLTASSEPFTIILYTSSLQKDLVCFLESYAERQKIPILSVHSVGYYSYFTLKLPAHLPVVDTHPDEDATADLRLLDPWPELSTFVSQLTKDIDDQTDHDHGHLPLVATLLHCLEEWKDAHQGNPPLAYSDKLAFRNLVANGARRNNPEGGEENFEEAVAAVMKHVTPFSLPSSLKQIFDYSNSTEISSSDSFWIIAKAVEQFYEKHHQLPLSGGIPDMKAESAVYIKLQSLYKAKARQDASEVMSTVRTLEGGIGVAQAEVELFCKNAKFIKLVQSSVHAPTLTKIVENELLNDELSAVAGPETPLSLISIYIALRASTLISTDSAEEIVDFVASSIPSLSGNNRLLQVAQEVIRSNRGEVHNTAAITGGMVSQEMIKLITNQYVPIDNTCIFDGIESRCQVLRLNLSEHHFQE
ncbi:ThiF family protein [Metarhizium robertsii]|uniref:NEDD8-activating enzyme E1 regulatory subunit n=2 Tax=Metarhizium robertsii TaxID=568076 RepID=E9ERW8_METRA|nr:ubiquitin-like activating enzyme (UlaA) [Metarhizium robertsii ARSEF 23]EFZ01485.2 ubiquitin-like activating enzyme (UlaA) [Metarhizium robertsii ARSEF 23]EXV01314.1 ThiF family protein [Metarhizium robertsii]